MIKINVIPEGGFPVICAWCGEICHYSTIFGSHGICETCKKGALKELEIEGQKQ